MTHEIQYQYDEILHASLPGLEIHVVYECESEITFDENGLEEINRLTKIAPFVNGQPAPFTTFPEEKHGQQARKFLARLQGAARQALYVQQMRESEYADPNLPGPHHHQARCNLERAAEELEYYQIKADGYYWQVQELQSKIENATPETWHEIFLKARQLCREMEKTLTK